MPHCSPYACSKSTGKDIISELSGLCMIGEQRVVHRPDRINCFSLLASSKQLIDIHVNVLLLSRCSVYR